MQQQKMLTLGTALLSQLGTTGAPMQPHSAVQEQGCNILFVTKHCWKKFG